MLSASGRGEGIEGANEEARTCLLPQAFFFFCKGLCGVLLFFLVMVVQGWWEDDVNVGGGGGKQEVNIADRRAHHATVLAHRDDYGK